MNEGNYAMWDAETKAYTDSLKDPAKWGGKPYSARYIGSLVSVCARKEVCRRACVCVCACACVPAHVQGL